MRGRMAFCFVEGEHDFSTLCRREHPRLARRGLRRRWRRYWHAARYPAPDRRGRSGSGAHAGTHAHAHAHAHAAACADSACVGRADIRLRGSDKLDGNTASFDGVISGGRISGRFGGWFFGPQGIEAGIALNFYGTTPNGTYFEADGVVLLKR